MANEIKLDEVLNIFKSEEINQFLLKYTKFTLEEKSLLYKDISENWTFLGNNSSNYSPIGILTKGEKGIIERLTNAIDAVIEKQRIKNNIRNPKKAEDVVSKAFPKFYHKYLEAKIDGKQGINAYEAEDQVTLAINDGSKTNKPTFDIVDKGIGVVGKEFASTLLSLNKGNKLSSDKDYLIGAFGQGGSTSLPFATSTLIISKKDNEFFFTIIKMVDLSEYKNSAFVYFTFNGEIPKLAVTSENDYNKFSKYIMDFIKSESGTLVRMIETDISREFRISDASKSGLADYINTELFETILPIKIIENRKDYQDNIAKQNRNSYGAKIKLNTTSKYIRKENVGTISIEHNNKTCNVDYFIILPKEEKNWTNELECKRIFKKFNTYSDPIIYTVNGQAICTEKYEKLKKENLSYLKYKLLIVVNLDFFGNDKYKFFTSDRSRIKSTDLTKGFLEKIIKNISSNEKIREINEFIGEKAISYNFSNEEELKEIANEVKDLYSDFMQAKSQNQGFFKKGNTSTYFEKNNEEIFSDFIREIKITSKDNLFYSNQLVKFTLETKASKYVNKNSTISAFVDNKEFKNFNPVFMNGRINYIAQNNQEILPGQHSIYFMLFDKNNRTLDLESKEFQFQVLNIKTPYNEEISRIKTSDLDLEIVSVDGAELICDIIKDTSKKKIEVRICFNHSLLENEIYQTMKNEGTDKIKITKSKMVKPMAIFSLLLEDLYEKKEPDEKNKMIISHVRSINKLLN